VCAKAILNTLVQIKQRPGCLHVVLGHNNQGLENDGVLVAVVRPALLKNSKLLEASIDVLLTSTGSLLELLKFRRVVRAYHSYSLWFARVARITNALATWRYQVVQAIAVDFDVVHRGWEWPIGPANPIFPGANSQLVGKSRCVELVRVPLA
jgi:hypothetical protein